MKVKRVKRWKGLPENTVKKLFCQEIENQVTATNLSSTSNKSAFEIYSGLIQLLKPIYGDYIKYLGLVAPIVADCLCEYYKKQNWDFGIHEIDEIDVYNIAIRKKLIKYV